MPSNIDETLPVYGAPTTESVRRNFSIAKIEITDLQARTNGGPFLPLATGGTITGPLAVTVPPTYDDNVATKGYVDTAVSSQSLWRGTYQVALNIPALNTMTDVKPGYAWSCTTADPNVPEPLTVALPPLPIGTMLSTGDSLHFSADGWAVVKGSGLTIDVTDELYVKLVGSTMTGSLILAGAPTVPLEASTKAYVDGRVASVTTASIGALPLSGGTLTGPLTLSGAPVNALHAAPKQYVDASITTALVPYAPLNNPALTGVPTAPTAANADNSTQIATTAFVKSLAYAPINSPTFTGIPQAVSPPISDNSNRIATTAFVWNQGYAPLNSPTFTGSPRSVTTGQADNTNTIATTAFVQGRVGSYLPLVGGTITGSLTVGQNLVVGAQTNLNSNVNISGGLAVQSAVSTHNAFTVADSTGMNWSLFPGSSNLYLNNSNVNAFSIDPAGNFNFPGSVTTGALHTTGNLSALDISVRSGTFSGSISTASLLANSTIQTNGAGGYAFYAPSGGIYCGGGPVTSVTGTSSFSLVQINGGGNALYVPGGNVYTAATCFAAQFQSIAGGTALYLPGANASIGAQLNVGGDCYAANFYPTCDETVKLNIEPATADCLAAICGLTLVSYDRDERHIDVGVTAQDVELHMPNAVAENPHQDGLLTVDLLQIVAYLIGAVQQLVGRLETLEAKGARYA